VGKGYNSHVQVVRGEFMRDAQRRISRKLIAMFGCDPTADKIEPPGRSRATWRGTQGWRRICQTHHAMQAMLGCVTPPRLVAANARPTAISVSAMCGTLNKRRRVVEHTYSSLLVPDQPTPFLHKRLSADADRDPYGQSDVFGRSVDGRSSENGLSTVTSDRLAYDFDGTNSIQ
jgi:hypothetical protein